MSELSISQEVFDGTNRGKPYPLLAGIDAHSFMAGTTEHPPLGTEFGGIQLQLETRALFLVLLYPENSFQTQPSVSFWLRLISL